MIAQDWRNALERDFDVDPEKLEVYKAALTHDEVIGMDLPPSMAAKETSPTYAAFVER